MITMKCFQNEAFNSQTKHFQGLFPKKNKKQIVIINHDATSEVAISRKRGCYKRHNFSKSDTQQFWCNVKTNDQTNLPNLSKTLFWTRSKP